MPKSPADTPKALRPYLSHLPDLAQVPGSTQAVCECPWCGKAKFYVNVETGLWCCHVCAPEGGNDLTFLRKLHDEAGAPPDLLAKLVSERGIPADELLSWGVAYSPSSGGWVFPGYDEKGRLIQLYKWGRNPRTKKGTMFATAGMSQSLLGVNLFDPSKPDVHICEGHFDGPAFRSALGRVKRTEDGLALTGNPDVSLLATANVLAVPGCQVMDDVLRMLQQLCAGKRVVLWFDSDHYRVKCAKCRPVKTWTVTSLAGPLACPACGGMTTGSADRPGYDGMRRVAEALAANPATLPVSVGFVKWGENGFDPQLKDGFDVRDSLKADTVDALTELLGRVSPIPTDWIPGRVGADSSSGIVRMRPERCESWAELVSAWKKPLKWSADLEHMLAMCLASVISTPTQGEQIWLLIMAPPSSGKTTILEGLAVCDEFIYCQNELGGVYSGYKTSKEGTEDYGIVPKIDGKTFIVMDGDPILKNPNRGMIFAQYRALYDGVGRKVYRNGLNFDTRPRFTKIIAGTGAMREMDASEVGARYINVCFDEKSNIDHKWDVCRRVFFRAVTGAKTLANGSEASRMSPEMATAKRKTGGYVEYLRRNAEELTGRVEIDESSPVVDAVIRCGMLASLLRARPSRTQDEVAEAEQPFRLTEQYTRTAVCLAAVLGKTTIDTEIYNRVRRVTLDTCRGRTMTIARLLHKWGKEGMEVDPLRIASGEAEEKIRPLLRFMRKIGAVDQFTVHHTTGAKIPARWRLTDELADLYARVVEGKTDDD